MKAKYDVVIVGSGIGGLSAAQTLSGYGLDILIIDENVQAGGQLLRKSKKQRQNFLKFDPDVVKKKGFSLISKVNGTRPGIDRIGQAQVLGVFRDRRLLIHAPKEKSLAPSPGQIMEVRAEHLILATGARERYLPFKGWTLPGVMSLGAAQILMKSHGVLPSFNTLIAGTSPLMMVLAWEIISNGGRVTAMMDANPFSKKLGFLPLIHRHWPKLMEGGFYIGQMILNQVPMAHGTQIIEALGKGKLESVIAVKTRADGRVVKGSETQYPAQTLAMGHGFVPNIELAVQAGCDIGYDKNKGGWVVSTDPNLESSVESIYAVGEITGVAGGKKSHIQGQMAAISILKKMGKFTPKDQGGLAKTIEELKFQNSQQTAYGAFLNHLSQLPASAYEQICDDTLICRCENITMGTIRQNIQLGFTSLAGIKKATRAGMGRCQGRICTAVVSDILMALTQKTPEKIGMPLSRAPVKNVAVHSFLDKQS